MLPVAAGAGEPLGQHQHRLHRHDHVGLEHRVDVLPQFQAGLPAVVVAEHPERMAVPEGPVLQQVVLGVDLVQRLRNVAANGAGHQPLLTLVVDQAVDLPDAEVLVGRLLAEQGPLEGRVVAGDHREAVEAQDVAPLDPPGGDRVVGAVRVDPRLEPGPGVHQLDMGERAGDLSDHRLRRVQRHLVLRHTLGDGLHAGGASDVADAGAVGDDGDLLVGLEHPQAHAVGGDVDDLRAGQGGPDLSEQRHVDVVVLDAEAAIGRHQRLHGPDVVVTPPVGEHHVLAERPTPRLSGIDVRRDRRRLLLGDHQSVGAAERAVEEVGVVVDVVDRREQHRVDAPVRHDHTQPVESALHLDIGERAAHLLAVGDLLQVGQVADHSDLV